MIHFDAHSDTTVKYIGDNRYTHGTPFIPGKSKMPDWRYSGK